MAANGGTVDHVLPVVGEPEIDELLQQGIPHALFGPAPEPDIDRVPLGVAPTVKRRYASTTLHDDLIANDVADSNGYGMITVRPGAKKLRDHARRTILPKGPRSCTTPGRRSKSDGATARQ